MFTDGLVSDIDLMVSPVGIPMRENGSLDIACDVDLGCLNAGAFVDFPVDFQSWVNLDSDTPFLDSIVIP